MIPLHPGALQGGARLRTCGGERVRTSTAAPEGLAPSVDARVVDPYQDLRVRRVFVCVKDLALRFVVRALPRKRTCHWWPHSGRMSTPQAPTSPGPGSGMGTASSTSTAARNEGPGARDTRRANVLGRGPAWGPAEASAVVAGAAAAMAATPPVEGLAGNPSTLGWGRRCRCCCCNSACCCRGWCEGGLLPVACSIGC